MLARFVGAKVLCILSACRTIPTRTCRRLVRSWLCAFPPIRLFSLSAVSCLVARLIIPRPLLCSMRFPTESGGANDMYDYNPKERRPFFCNPITSLPRRVLTSLALAVSFTILWLLLSYDHLPSFLLIGPASTTTTTHWHGWANVDNLFVLYDTNV